MNKWAPSHLKYSIVVKVLNGALSDAFPYTLTDLHDFFLFFGNQGYLFRARVLIDPCKPAISTRKTTRS